MFIKIIKIALASATLASAEVNNIDLSGLWNLTLDVEDEMLDVPSEAWTFDDTIQLPGTTDLAQKGTHVTTAKPFHFHLTREWEFTGPAYYSRSITIPEAWENHKVELFLERVMWQSRVWVDGLETSPPEDSLNTPHRHDLGQLAPGKHKLTIRVDNRMIHPIGDKGHAYGAQTQSIWNGVVGKLELRATPASHLSLIRVFPANDGTIKVEASGKGAGPISIKATCIDPAKPRAEKIVPFATAQANADGSFIVELQGKVNFEPQLWSEFSTPLYRIKLDLMQDGEHLDSKTVSFGFREVSRDGNELLINGKPAFMRGNLECAVFPKTGHPPVTVDEWKKVWQVYRDHNLNHARFHSWCPPEAAFTAADEMGIYLQVEAPIWIDHWMTRPNPRKEMDTQGYPRGLGKNDRSTDRFTLAEIRRTLNSYGNHPSFVFFALGNELGTSDFEVTGTWIRDAKAHDPRHLYAASTARTITPHCDFNATHNIPGIGRCRQRVNFGTDWDYEQQYSQASVPIIAHEIGQWPVYVDWEKELLKYTGPLKPYRLAEMAEEAKKNGLYARSAELEMASGASNRLLYRDEIESFLRTPSCRGFQLLGMQDFSGQGEALVGWLDSFYQSKGTTEPADFRRYCAPTVPLLKLPGYVFRNSEKPSIEALLHHYGASDINHAAAAWELTDMKGGQIDSGSLGQVHAKAGSVTSMGRVTPDFSAIKTAAQVRLTIGLSPSELSNSYTLWIYPEVANSVEDASVVVTGDWQGTAKPALAEGKPVVLIAHHLGGPAAAKLAHWFPLYWSVPFFPGQHPETLGLRVTADHPALNQFPTPPHGDWNWFRMCKGAHGFDLTSITPNSYRPIAEPVTDFHHNRRLGSIFEAKIGPGRLLVCGYNITDTRAKALPEVAQLRRSLIHYAGSKQFQPDTGIEVKDLDALFEDPTLKLQKLPADFDQADLYVNAAGKLGAIAQSVPWAKGHDQILRQSKGVDYSVKSDGIWRDQDGSAWHGSTMTISITPRSGVPGKLRVRFHDWNKNGRTGTVTFEDRTTQQIGAHADGVWVDFTVIREDTNDARLTLTTKSLTGPNLMITDIAFIPEE